ncbi:MAG TPA: hypothetical protein VGH27_07870 [Streptosporangiaceae bacterium]|jgi:hypothetical protein
MVKVLYKLMSLLTSVLGGILAGVIFKQIWWPGENGEQAAKAA